MKNNLVTRKITSLLLSGALVSMLAGSVSANTPKDVDWNLALRSQEAVASVSGGEVSQEVKEYCLSNGVEISEDSLVEILPLTTQKQQRERSAPSQVLAVTNRAGDQVQKDILVSYEKEGNALAKSNEEMVVKNIPAEALTIGSSRASHSPIFDDYNDFTIKSTAVYTVYTDPNDSWDLIYYQPIGCYFFLYKNNPNVDISYCGIQYTCQGTLYSYPDFKQAGGTYAYESTVYAYNPKTSEMYSRTNPLRSDRIIRIGSGGLFPGHSMTFEYTYNGLTDNTTVKWS